MLVLMLPLESLVFLWPRRVYGGSCKTCPFGTFQIVKIGGSLVRNARVSGFPVVSPCLWGKLQNLSFSKVSKQVVMSLCVAGVALCDIPTFLITCRKCQTWESLVRNARFSASTCLVSGRSFSWGIAVSMGEAAKPLLFEGFQACCHVVLRGTRGTLWHSNLFANVSKVSLVF